MIRGAVLGSPISHSLSPVLHSAAYDFLGIEGSYQAIDVSSGTLSSFVEIESANFDYFSLTMPLKEEVLSLGIKMDELTKQIQSANTLYRKGSTFTLTSTDGSGLVAALSHAGLTQFSKVLVLGAGGTARAVVGALDNHSEEIDVLGRSSIREEALAHAVRKCHFNYIRWTTDIEFTQYDLVVNTTPAGAADLLADSIQGKISTTLFDVIYKPWPTELGQRWKDHGGAVINGLELLLYQGIDQLELVLDSKLDRVALANHLRSVLTKAAR